MSNSFVGEGGRNFRFVIVGGKGQGNGAGASGVGAELSRPGLDGSLGVGSVVVMKILLVFKQDIFDLGDPCVFALEGVVSENGK